MWRWHDRLYISILDGKVLTLADCSLGDNSHYYEYARYDEPGGFHVVHVWRYEAHAYGLVMRNTGKIYTIPSLPVWSPDGARFAYDACSPPDDTTDRGDAEIGIMSIADSRPKIEAKAEMPCNAHDCKLDWVNDATVSAVCEDPHSSDGKAWVMRFSRRTMGGHRRHRTIVARMHSGRRRVARPAVWWSAFVTDYLFQCAGGQARDDPALQRQEQDQDRHDEHRRECHDTIPVGVFGANE